MTAPAALTERARRLFEEIRELEPADRAELVGAITRSLLALPHDFANAGLSLQSEVSASPDAPSPRSPDDPWRSDA